MSQIETKPDYQAIVKTEAEKLGATLFDLLDFDSYSLEGVLYEEPRISTWPKEYLYQAAWSNVETRQLFVQMPIEDELGAVIAMHELGHIATTPAGTPTVGDEAVQVEAKATCWGLSRLNFPLSPESAVGMLAALRDYAHQTGQPLDGLAGRLQQKLLDYGATEEAADKYTADLNARLLASEFDDLDSSLSEILGNGSLGY